MKENEVYVYHKSDFSYENLSDQADKVGDFGLDELLSCIQPGQKVVIKPNFVRQSNLKNTEWLSVITNPAVIEMVMEKVAKRLQGRGTISIMDAPQEDSDFNKLVSNIGLQKIINKIRYKYNINIECYDLRIEQKVTRNGIIVRRIKLQGDPKGYVHVNLGKDSCFYNKESLKFYGADYDVIEAQEFHNKENNIYVISKSILDCDVFIDMPKLKTHKIGGITCAMKNLIGIIGVKNCIPHHTFGTPASRGDCFPKETTKSSVEGKLKVLARKMLQQNNPLISYPIVFAKWILGFFLGKPAEVIRSGHWYGNDTLWRAIIDLNRILLYANREGKMCVEQQRRALVVVDAIIAGEGNGPMMPEEKKCNILAFGNNYLGVDTALCRLMGFDPNKVPSIMNGFGLKKYPLALFNKDDVYIKSNESRWEGLLLNLGDDDIMNFKPAFGWVGHIEWKRRSS